MGANGELTFRQKQILACVRQSMETTGRPPTHREIMAWCGLRAWSPVARHLMLLEAAGYLVRDTRIARGLRLTARGQAAANERARCGECDLERAAGRAT